MSVEAVREAMANLAAAYDAFAACNIDGLTRTEVVSVLDDYETLTCQMPTQTQRLLARLQAETSPREMGAKSWNQVLRIRWRLSTGEASRRLGEAAELAARASLTGQPLAPLRPAVAAAQAAGLITGEHVGVIRAALTRLPALGRHPHRRSRSRSTWCASRSVSGPKSCAIPPSCGCSCSIRTARSPMTPNGTAHATSPPRLRAVTR